MFRLVMVADRRRRLVVLAVQAGSEDLAVRSDRQRLQQLRLTLPAKGALAPNNIG